MHEGGESLIEEEAEQKNYLLPVFRSFQFFKDEKTDGPLSSVNVACTCLSAHSLSLLMHHMGLS